VFGALSALGAVLGGEGCSSSAPNPYPNVLTFCAAKAAAYCQSTGVLEQCGVSQDACVTAQTSTCKMTAAQATSSGTRAYESANAPACISAVAAAFTPSSPGSLTVFYSTLQDLAETCDLDVFPGSVPLMGACKTDDDCAQSSPADGGIPGVVCSPVSPGSKTLQCETSVGVATGAFCENPGSVCTDRGTYCVNGKNGYTCEPGATMGKVCTTLNGCSAAFACKIPAGEAKGTCVAPASRGSECATDEECAPTAPYCDMNVVPAGGKAKGACEVGLSFAVGGDDCKAFGG